MILQGLKPPGPNLAGGSCEKSGEEVKQKITRAVGPTGEEGEGLPRQRVKFPDTSNLGFSYPFGQQENDPLLLTH